MERQEACLVVDGSHGALSALPDAPTFDEEYWARVQRRAVELRSRILDRLDGEESDERPRREVELRGLPSGVPDDSWLFRDDWSFQAMAPALSDDIRAFTTARTADGPHDYMDTLEWFKG